MEPQISTMTLLGASFLVKRAGQGAPMVVVHGGGGSPRFLPALQALAQRFEVIVPQAPGFGGGQLPPWLESVGDLANFYLEFLDALDLRRVHLVGLSLGGWVAAELAMRNASRLASLALMDAPGLLLPGVAQLDPFLLNEEQGVRALFFDQTLADKAVATMLAPESEDVRLANQRTVARLAWQPRFHDPHLQRWLCRIRIPTLIIWGENDRLFPPVYGQAWAQAIAGARLAVVPRCGHLPIQEQPETFVRLVGEFCAERAES
ncbi:MAG TPA: alpha/beta hydrolase [Candidatus Binataceae bacterium]|nr:alpha/beta hydrolase [Candidatus Binataceae bacterium]